MTPAVMTADVARAHEADLRRAAARARLAGCVAGGRWFLRSLFQRVRPAPC